MILNEFQNVVRSDTAGDKNEKLAEFMSYLLPDYTKGYSLLFYCFITKQQGAKLEFVLMHIVVY